MIMFRLVILFCLFSFCHADVYDQKKILIINNLDGVIVLDPPILKNVRVESPDYINAHDQSVIVLDIDKDWLINNPVDVKYQQKITYKGAQLTLSLVKKTPDPSFSKPFTPGYECHLSVNKNNDLNIKEFGESVSFCNALYLY